MRTQTYRRYLIIILLCAAGIGTASAQRLVNTTALLTSAGFHVRTAETNEQRLLYGVAPSYRVLRAGTPWESFYAYKDEASGVAYVGDEVDYQRFCQLAAQVGVPYGGYQARDMELDPAWRWSVGVRWPP